MTNADPAIRERLARAADHIDPDVERRLVDVREHGTRRSSRQRAVALAVAGLIALVAIAVAWLALPRHDTSVAPVEPSQTDPTGFLIFVHDGTDSFPPAITARPADGGDGTVVSVPNPDVSNDWDWSPDHTRVVWLETITRGERTQRLMVGRVDPRSVSMPGSHPSDPLQIGELSSFLAYQGRAFSPDSQRFAYAAASGNKIELYVVDLMTGTSTAIASWEGTTHVDVDWAPDASRLAVGVTGGSEPGIYTMAPDGSDVRKISDLSTYRIGWSPTAPTLVAEVLALSSARVWILGADGSDPRPLSPPEAVDLGPVWSPDGAWIAFSRDTTPGDPQGQPQIGTTVFLMRADGSDLHRMQAPPDEGWNEVWDWVPVWPMT